MHTEETKKKISLNHRKYQSAETRKKLSDSLKKQWLEGKRTGAWRIGRKWSEEVKQKMRRFSPNRKWHRTEWHKNILRENGRKHILHTEETRKLISIGNTGKKRSFEQRKNISKSHADFSGRNNPNWYGGISREPYGWDFDKALRELIRKRDNYKCRLCNVPQEECLKQLHIHHVDYDKQNNNPSNLVSLCNSCHTKTNYKRLHWQGIFHE